MPLAMGVGARAGGVCLAASLAVSEAQAVAVVAAVFVGGVLPSRLSHDVDVVFP